MTIRTVAVVFAGIAIASGCSSSPEESPHSEEAVPRGPVSCLADAGLRDVETREATLWRGFHDEPFYQVSVTDYETPVAAREAAAEATDVFAAHGGRFMVDGPTKPSAGGLVTESEAAEAQQIVDAVAACLE